jgi:hypothetical protein
MEVWAKGGGREDENAPACAVLPIYAAGDEAGCVLRCSASSESPARTDEGKETRASLPRWAGVDVYEVEGPKILA